MHSHTWLDESVVVGANCKIAPGAVIGCEGFGYDRADDGTWTEKSHAFGVHIGDDVSIGPNTVICRGSWRDTKIQDGAKLDGLVFIAHNVIVGKHAIVVANAEVSGSVTLGDGCWIGPGACIRQRVTVGARALVGMGAVVVRDVDPDTTVAGNPARVLDAHRGVHDGM